MDPRQVLMWVTYVILWTAAIGAIVVGCWELSLPA